MRNRSNKYRNTTEEGNPTRDSIQPPCVPPPVCHTPRCRSHRHSGAGHAGRAGDDPGGKDQPPGDSVDVLVVGGGTAGAIAAIQAARAGAATVLVEMGGQLGGTTTPSQVPLQKLREVLKQHGAIVPNA